MKTPLVFRIYKNDQIHVVKQFVDDQRIVIGNGPEVQIDLGAEISPIHCMIEKRGDQFYICDLGSENGTYIGKRLILDEPISNGDSFQIGLFTIVFFIGAQKASEVATNIPPVAQMQQQQKAIIKPVVAGKPNIVTSGKSKVDTTSFRKKKYVKTFAPKSEFNDLKDHLKVGSGNHVEVIVSWKERIINTYHFAAEGKKTLGLKGDISVPEGSAPKNWLLLNLVSGVIIKTTSEMKVEVLRDGEVKTITGAEYKLQQSEACFIQLINGMQLVIRFAPKSPIMVFESPLVLGSSELTGLLAALIIAVLVSLLISVNKTKDPNVDENVERLAKVIFTMPPPPEITKVEPPAPNAELLKKMQELTPKEEVKQAIVLEKKPEIKIAEKLVKAEKKAEVKDIVGLATEIKPKDPKLKAKMFTSNKQAKSIKTGETAGANAQSKELDPKNSGLLSAFGTGGARTKLDQVYSGSGELIGAGEKAKGTSGFNKDRQGNDLGSNIKDTGAGGTGTATQGIASIGTKGRSTSLSGSGSGSGFGDKDKVQISAGGNEESFSGSIDKEAVRRVIMSALSQFKSCYEREYRQNTKLEGKVVIAWEIHEQGLAKNARVVREKSDINNKLVEECVRLRMLGLRFPEPPAGSWADISFPFVFHGQKF